MKIYGEEEIKVEQTICVSDSDGNTLRNCDNLDEAIHAACEVVSVSYALHVGEHYKGDVTVAHVKREGMCGGCLARVSESWSGFRPADSRRAGARECEAIGNPRRPREEASGEGEAPAITLRRVQRGRLRERRGAARLVRDPARRRVELLPERRGGRACRGSCRDHESEIITPIEALLDMPGIVAVHTAKHVSGEDPCWICIVPRIVAKAAGLIKK